MFNIGNKIKEIQNSITDKSKDISEDKICKMRISKKIEAEINSQIKKELESSYLYHSISKWCLDKGFFNSSKLFAKYADEEKGHANKMIDYLLDRKATYKEESLEPLFKDLKKESLKEMFEESLKHEYFISDAINSIVEECVSEKDIPTRLFYEWFVNEQVEEEAKFINIIDKYYQINGDLADFLIDTHYISTLM